MYLMKLTRFEKAIREAMFRFNAALPPGTAWVLVVSETASELTTHLAGNVPVPRAIKMVDHAAQALRTQDGTMMGIELPN
jgi:hypothetical protein